MLGIRDTYTWENKTNDFFAPIECSRKTGNAHASRCIIINHNRSSEEKQQKPMIGNSGKGLARQGDEKDL